MTQWSDPPRPGAPGIQRTRLRRTWPQRILLTLGVLSTVAVLLAAAGLSWGLARYRHIQFLSVPEVEPAASGEPSNWLLVGSDSRDGIDPNDPNAGVFLGEEVSGKRTDTIIVARVDPGARTVDLLSVPRDLWVPIAGTGENGRINSAFAAEAGEARLVATVEDVLDIEINNYAEVNFVGFQAVIDALGGVPIWFETPVRDPNSGLDIPTAGCHSLTGFEALAFARSRTLEYHDGSQWLADPTGDLGRTARQQFLLTRLATTASSELDLTDFATIDRILRVGGENLLIDDGAGASDLLGLARTFASVGGEGIRRHALPVEGFRTSGGASVLALQGAEAQPVLEIFRTLDPGEEPPAAPAAIARDSFQIDVLNGAQISGLAAATAEELGGAGFLVGEIGNAPALVDQTVVRYPGLMAAEATVVGTSLAAPPVYEVDDALEVVVLVVGPDYVGLGDSAPSGAEPVGTDQATAHGAGAPAEEPAPAPAAPQAPVENQVGVVPGPGPADTPCA